jgi:paraquat-inducible protein B
VPALFEGAIAFDTPQGDTGAAGQDFPLYASQDEADNAPDSRSIAYRVVFHDASGVPDKNAPVKLMGKRVGSVGDSKLRYDPVQGRMSVIATIMLDPSRIALPDGVTWNNPRAQMDDMMRHLIASGLHAELAASPPVLGGQLVSLRLVAGQAGALGNGPVPEIPTQEGGDVAGIMAGVSDVVARVNQMPLSRIADNLRDISQHIAGLTGSPELTDTLHHIDRATANLQRVSKEARMQLPPALAELRHTVSEAQASLESANNLLSARGSTASGPGTEGLPQTLYEISRTARSLRGLSDMLNEHPQALLTGRAGGQ